ncbi:SAM-dependent methyltransferase, partial [Klebsiella pneumoniae]|nr:SAM-dependent methyltransferase [Klebsiella pneumoniae]
VDRNVPVIKDEWITLECNPAYIFGGDVGFQDFRVRANLSVELVSYMIGCMMGRYSLDEPSLIYAHSGNIGFDPSRYRKFSADADGIIPISDDHWFEDDAAERVGEFVKLVWGADTFVENMEWLSDSLGRKAGETADEAIR